MRHMNISLSAKDAAENLHNISFWSQPLFPGWRQNHSFLSKQACEIILLSLYSLEIRQNKFNIGVLAKNLGIVQKHATVASNNGNGG